MLPKARGDGVLLGYLLTALIFFKITAAIAMLGLVVAAVLLGRARPAVLFVMLAGCRRCGGACRAGHRRSGLRLSARHRLDECVEPGRLAYRLASSSARNWLPIVVTITIVALAIRELDFAAAVRRPLEFVRDTIARQAFAVDTALLVAIALAAESQNTGGVGLIAAARRTFPPEPAR